MKSTFYLALALGLNASAAIAAGVDPADMQRAVPAAIYESAFATYRGGEVEMLDWRAANAAVGGGGQSMHQGHDMGRTNDADAHAASIPPADSHQH